MYPSQVLGNHLHLMACRSGGLESLVPQRSRLESHARHLEAQRRRQPRAGEPAQGSITLRSERADDAAAIARLAALDSAPVPRGPLLVAVVAGAPRAALSLADGATVADPFMPTADLVALLRVRAEQTHGRGWGRRLRDRLALWERLWARVRPGEIV